MAKENDILIEYGDRLCTILGFNPTSNSTKPLYVANGLFRCCTGKICDIKDVHEWIVSERRSDQKILTSSEIRDKYHDILIHGIDESVEDIKEARFILEQIFNPDSAVYPGYQNSALNISSKWLVRAALPAEARLGEFIHGILAYPINGRPSPAIELIQNALKNDDDDISRLIKPIITNAYKARIVDQEQANDTPEMNISKHIIRTGFDNLTTNIAHIGQAENSLLVLKRLTNFAIFSAYFYLADINRSMYSGDRIPLLLDAASGLDAIERASELSFIACKKSVEAYTVNVLEQILIEDKLIADTEKPEACRTFLNSIALNSVNEEKHVREALIRYFDMFVAGGDIPLRALARAMQFAIYTFTYPNNTPSDFCRVLGTRAGLVGPGGNATKFKRLLIHRFLLETIVLSSVNLPEISDGIELRELGELLRSQYGIIIGTDTDKDYLMLDNAKIAQDAPEDLRGELANNASTVADMLITIGLAKRYADGVTIIGWGL